MIRLEPDVGRLIRWAERHRLLASRQDDDLGYALHALLEAAFDTFAPKPFALLREAKPPAALLAYSTAPSDQLREHAQCFAAPDAAEAIGLDTLAVKTMPEVWTAGRRLGFSVRVRPMLRTDREGDRARAKEVDAFVLAPEQADRGAVYGEWLRRHVPGAAIEQASLEAFRLSVVSRRGRPEGPEGRRPLKHQLGPDATFSGVLAITDGEAFAGGLARGIGRHRSFGFGMLLLRPAR